MKKNLLLIIPFLVTLSLFPGKSKSGTSEPKMFYHVMLFKWKPEVNEDQIFEVDNLWNGMRKQIGGFDTYEMNPLEPGNFDHVVILGFSTLAAYNAYQEHEDHQKIKEIAPGLIEQFSEFDYWK